MDNFEISVQRFEQFAEEYAQRFDNLDAYSDSVDEFCRLISTNSPLILDLGCGPGNVTKLLYKRFPTGNITAIDLSPSMIKIANKQLPEVDFIVMDVRNISIIPVKFDAIMCSFCLPFLSKSDAAKLIADCSRLLMSGGVLYISTMEGNEQKAGFETTSFSGDAEIYFNYYRQEDLEFELIKNGFKIRQTKLQDYTEPDGRTTIDMLITAVKR
jgi:ubiquinone/menaquinone biosynthesis C-methylase UbiE